MKVSVIIPVYRQEKYLKRCLESLAKQTFKDFEVIVVIDKDDKNSKLKKQILRFSLKIRKLKVIKQNHQGAAIARNTGVKYAQGKILIFIDADMVFAKDFLQDLIRPIELKQAKGTFSKNEWVANWENRWARCWNYNLNLPLKRRLPDDYPNEAPVFRAILKSEFQKAGGFIPRGYDDDWTLSEKLGYRAKAVSGAIYYHYNPENLREIFEQARWWSKRSYKLGLLGEVANLLLFTLPFSLLFGLFKAIYFQEFNFLFFKIVFDTGAFLGLIEKILFKRYY